MSIKRSHLEYVRQESQRKRRKTEILLEIAMAGEDLEKVIDRYAEDIDQEMIEILEDRTKAARRYASPLSERRIDKLTVATLPDVLLDCTCI